MQKKLFINGLWQASCSGEMLDVVDPSDLTVFHQFSAGNAEDIDSAIVWINCSQPTFTEAPWAVTNNQASGANWANGVSTTTSKPNRSRPMIARPLGAGI